VSARELRPVGPVEHLDRALLVARRGGLSRAARAWGASAIPAVAVVAVYYVERVEGMRGLRLPLAMVLVLAWCARAVLLAPVVRADAQALWDGLRVPPGAGGLVDVVRTALVVALGLWVWAWLLVAGALGGALGVAFVLVEPLRAGSIAARFLDARVREDGLDLRALVDEAVASNERAASRAVGRAALVLCVAGGLALVAEPAAAQSHGVTPRFGVPPTDDATRALDAVKPRPGDARSGDEHTVAQSSVPFAEGPREAADDAVRTRVDAVLARPEFREFAPERGAGVTELIAKLLAWLLRPRDLPRFSAPAFFSLAMPGGWFFVLFAALLFAAVLAYLWRTVRPRAARGAPGMAPAVVALDVRERPPESILDEAGVLASRGALREALRALYLATLVALDRRRLIAFDPHRTNWQYLRAMPRGEARRLFAEFTRIFDHKWYGAEPTALTDYEACRALAARIVRDTAGGGAS